MTSSSVISAALILGTTVVDGMVRLVAPLQVSICPQVQLVNNQRCSTRVRCLISPIEWVPSGQILCGEWRASVPRDSPRATLVSIGGRLEAASRAPARGPRSRRI